MEFQKFLISNNLQSFEQVKTVLEVEPYSYRLKVDEEVYPTLYCICSTEKTPSTEKWMRECNGLIVEKETNRIVCYSFDKMEDFEGGIVNPAFDPETSHLELSVEGALIRVYFYGGKWMISTKKCVNAMKSRWLSKKSFHEMFEEAFPRESFGKLDMTNCYSFILGHPENSMVVSYDVPQLFHVGTRNMTTLEESEVDLGVAKIPKQKVEGGDLSLLAGLATSTNLAYEGYVLVDAKHTRQKFISPIYKRAKEVWGNTNYRFYRYLELRKEGEHAIVEYLTFFPKDKDAFLEYESQFVGLCQFVLNTYADKHVSKDTKEIPKYLKRLIYDIHGEFLKTRIVTDLVKVMSWISKLDVKLICHMYHNWQNDLKNPSNQGAGDMIADMD